MTYSHSDSHTMTFTSTDAVYIATKVATDLKRMQRFYGEPSNEWIQNFEIEVIGLLMGGYMGTMTYGFWRNGYWIEPTLFYTARDLSGVTASDDDPGRIKPGASIDGASFYSYLTYSTAWYQLLPARREEFAKQLPFQRSDGPKPGVDGYLSKDLTYSAGDRALDRASLRHL